MRRILQIVAVLAVLAFPLAAQDNPANLIVAGSAQDGPTRGELWTQPKTFRFAMLDIELIEAVTPFGHAGLGFGVDLGARFISGKVFRVAPEHVKDVGLAATLGWGLGREFPSFFHAADIGEEGQAEFVSASSQRVDALLDFGEHVLPAVTRYVKERWGLVPAFVVSGGFLALDYYLIDKRDIR